ncbi:hypothetical protein [Neobacillus sp. 19]|uniref:hypothetical protein n=1 Tax=Neobacillus sp. 19 TaxID=3394458 RepID=UPI003BF642AC
MHTTKQVRSDYFEFSINDQPSSFDEVFPDFHSGDRVGVVVRESGGAIGASALFMASIARFYDFYRSQLGNNPGELRIYPDFYVFHVGRRDTEHYWFDIWPPNKEVDVIDEPELILEAINDRGISRLIIPDAPRMRTKTFYTIPKENQIESEAATFLQETVSSAEKRIKTCVIYSPTGRTERSDVMIKSNVETESNVYKCIKDSHGLSDELRIELKNERQNLLDKGRVIETYRRTSLTEAISMLSTSLGLSETTLHYLSNMRRPRV